MSERYPHSHLPEINRMKDFFLPLIAHDLRSPLSNVRGFLEIIAEEEDPGERGALLKRTIGIVDHLLKMVEGLLDTSRFSLTGYRLAKTVFSLKALVDEQPEQLAVLTQHKKISIKNEIPEELQIFADEALLGAVTLNLVSNAVKFCPVGSVIRITYSHDGNDHRVNVMDNGPGISLNHQQYLFSYEVKRHAAGTQTEKSAGLGLALCRDILGVHGGTLSVKSTPGEGAVFSLSIPIEQEPAR